MTAMFYRRTSVETKRLDSLMRSALYASYSGMFTFTIVLIYIMLTSHLTEALTGLSTIRGYSEQVSI